MMAAEELAARDAQADNLAIMELVVLSIRDSLAETAAEQYNAMTLAAFQRRVTMVLPAARVVEQFNVIEAVMLQLHLIMDNHAAHVIEADMTAAATVSAIILLAAQQAGRAQETLAELAEQSSNTAMDAI